MNNLITLLNPFSVKLEHHPFVITENKPVFASGDFRVYKYCERWYLHTFKNIIFGERVGINKDLINNVQNDIKPEGEGRAYFDYQRGKEFMAFGIETANKLNFKIQ
jgi:hypothetical protein